MCADASAERHPGADAASGACDWSRDCRHAGCIVAGGYGADLQVEAAGAPPKTLPEMERSLAIGGKIAWIGRADRTAPIFVERFQTHRAQIYGSQGHSGHFVFYNVIRLMASGKLDTSKMVTARFPLDRYEEAFELLIKGRSHAKVQFKL